MAFTYFSWTHSPCVNFVEQQEASNMLASLVLTSLNMFLFRCWNFVNRSGMHSSARAAHSRQPLFQSSGSGGACTDIWQDPTAMAPCSSGTTETEAQSSRAAHSACHLQPILCLLFHSRSVLPPVLLLLWPRLSKALHLCVAQGQSHTTNVC